MSRRNLSRDSVKALVPILVPLVPKVVLPIALESMRRRKFDPDRFLQDAGESLGKGLKQTRAELDDVKDEVFERGQKVYEEARKQGRNPDVWRIRGCPGRRAMDRVQPPKRRGFPFVKVMVVLGVVGVGLALLGRK
jgi:hypothetical protein